MSDFSQPVYASYVALCRELKLKHHFVAGDQQYLTAGWDPSSRATIEIWDRDAEDYASNNEADEMQVWLPSLSDWLEMLEAAGWPEAMFYQVDEGWAIGSGGFDCTDESAAGPTREEAAARLWVAVTKSADHKSVSEETE